MSKLDCDIKYLYRESTGHRFICVVTEEVTKYLVTFLLYKGPLHEIRKALINNASYLIFDEDQAFLSSVLQQIYKRLGIKIKTITPFNHGSIKTEEYTSTKNEMIAKQLTGKG